MTVKHQWPSFLPQYPLIEEGNCYKYLLSKAQANMLDSFYLLSFDRSFSFPDPHTGINGNYKFIGIPEYGESNGNFYKVSIELKREDNG